MLLVAGEGSNPLVPNAWELTGSVIGAMALVILVLAMVGVARARHLSAKARAAWVLVLLALPVLGPVLWFLLGRRHDAPERIIPPESMSTAEGGRGR